MSNHISSGDAGNVELYSDAAQQFAPLSLQEERYLCALMQRGPSEADRKEAREKIITAYIPLVTLLAYVNRPNSTTPQMKELVSSGNLALVTGVDSFAPKGPETLSRWIYKAIDAQLKETLKPNQPVEITPNNYDNLCQCLHVKDVEQFCIKIETECFIDAALAEAVRGLAPRERVIVMAMHAREEQQKPQTLALVYGISEKEVRDIDEKALKKLHTIMTAAKQVLDETPSCPKQTVRLTPPQRQPK